MNNVNRYKTDLRGKVAILVACTSGIGLAIAERFLECNAKVVICSRNKQNVDDSIKELLQIENVTEDDIIGTVCHVSDESQRKAVIDLAISKFGKIDILFENAGVNPAYGVNPIDITESMWNKTMNVNVVSLAMFIKEVFPYMKKNGGGKIITMGSIAAYDHIFMLGAYSVSKTAVISLTNQLSRPLAKYNIQINCIVPGRINTKFSKKSIDDLSPEINAIHPVKRIANPEEIAGSAIFLASSDSNYMTGETMVLSGGFYSRL